MVNYFVNQLRGGDRMVLDTFYEENIEIVFSYLPIWEMFFSMHVLSNPEHHISRKKWSEIKEKEFPELVKRIRELGSITDLWNIIIDSDKWSEVRHMDIQNMIVFFQHKNIYQWNEWIEYTGRTMSIEERDAVLEVIGEYYTLVFQKEEISLRSYIKRVLQDEKERCQKEGLWEWCKKIHSRLCVGSDTIVFLKNHEYRIEKEKIKRVIVTVSTFVTPHLWLYNKNYELEIVKGIIVEQEKDEISEELMWVFKAMGDLTRLHIIKHLLHGICTTQALAKEMKLSEPAISKHLKIMQKAGLVKKAKNGFYMVYEFDTERVDYIPYLFYEIMLQKQ